MSEQEVVMSEQEVVMSEQASLSGSKDIGIIVMGLTGAGKSAYISRLTEQDIAIGHTLRSCTTRVNGYAYRQPHGQRIWLIDTPGFDDTNKANPTILREIVSFLCSFCNEENLVIGGLLYIHRITDIRMAGSSLTSLRIFEALCGEACFGDVTIITTMWDTLHTQAARDLAQDRELALQHEENFFGRLTSKGAGFKRSSKEGPSGTAVIDAIADRKKTVTLAVQMEMMSKANVKLADTSVGKYLGGNLELARQKLEKRLNQVEASNREGSDDDDDLIADIREQTRLLNKTAGDPDYLNVTYEELRSEHRMKLGTDMLQDVDHELDTAKTTAELKLEHEIGKLRKDKKQLQQGQKQLNKAREKELAQQHIQIQSLEDALAHEKAQRDNKYKISGFFDFLLGRTATASTARNETVSPVHGEVRETRQHECRTNRTRKSRQQDRKPLDVATRASMLYSELDHTSPAGSGNSQTSTEDTVPAYEHSLVKTPKLSSPGNHTRNGGFPANVIVDPSGIRRNYLMPSSPAIPRTIPVYEEAQSITRF